MITDVRRLTLAVLATALIGALASQPASAEAAALRQSPLASSSDDRGTIRAYNGNGKYNKTYSAVNSPTNMRGVQQVSNTTISGSTHTQAALCKKRHICKIKQKFGFPHRW